MGANSNSMQGGAWQVTSGLTVNNAATKTWTHNRGAKAQMVFLVDSVNKDRLAATVTVTQASVNTIAITNGSGGNLTMDVVVFWDPPTQDLRASVATSSWV